MASESRDLNDSLVKVSVLKTIYAEIKSKLDAIGDKINDSKITIKTSKGEKGSFTVNQSANSSIDISPSYEDIVAGLKFTPPNTTDVVHEGEQTGFVDLKGATVETINTAVAEVSNMKLETDLTGATTIINI